MTFFDKFAEKYVAFIHTLLKYWFVWGVVVFGALIVRYVTLPEALLWLSGPADWVWGIVLRARYVLLPLGVMYILCRRATTD